MIRYNDPILRSIPLRRLLDRMLEDMVSLQSYQQPDNTPPAPQAQIIPVNVFQTPDQVVLVAPMPGVSQDDIEVNVTHDTVQLKAHYRGPHQEDQDYLLREWSYGPYERTLQLSVGVDAERANASFNNGVLVLNLPKRDVTRAHRVKFGGINSSHGIEQNRSGHASLHAQEDGSQEPGSAERTHTTDSPEAVRHNGHAAASSAPAAKGHAEDDPSSTEKTSRHDGTSPPAGKTDSSSDGSSGSAPEGAHTPASRSRKRAEAHKA